MQVHFSQCLLGMDGQPVRDAQGTVVLLSHAVSSCMLSTDAGDDPKEKDARFRIAQLMQDVPDGPVSMSVEDLALIKKYSMIKNSVLVHGRIVEAIEDGGAVHDKVEG